MNKTLQRFVPGLLVVALAAGGGVALTTLAHAQSTAGAPAAPMPPMPPRPPGERGDPGMRGGHMMRDVERLKASLKLTPGQVALWDRAQEQMKPPTDRRDRMKARRDRMAAMLDDPNFDPRRMAAEMDGATAERRAKMSSLRDAWFAVYDSLNPVQRGQVREFLRSRMGRPHGMGGPMEWHRGGRDGGPGMGMPR